jgi:hypothetical protein
MCLSAYHVIMIIAVHRIWCTVCIFTYTIASYRIAGESASSSARETDRVRSTRNPGTGGARVEEQEDDLPECVDHQSSSFERGKPQSILSLLLYKNNSLSIWVLYVVALSYRNWVKPLMHLLLSLPTLLLSYPVRFKIE